jgi:hypothetical protein
MHKRIFILASAITFAISAGAQVGAIDLNRPGSEHDYTQEPEREHEKQKYTCPMHPAVVANHPGNCPNCGMKLVPVDEEKKRPNPINREQAHNAQH